MYQTLKRIYLSKILYYQRQLVAFNSKMNSRKIIKDILRRNNIPKLEPHEVAQAKAFYKSKGYKLKNTYWHRFYKFANGEFHKDYLPLDIFRAIIEPNINRRLYWPALVDKNLTSNIFDKFNQPETVVSNINGFYYMDNTMVKEAIAVDACNNAKAQLIIKPTVESGQGKMVKKFTLNNEISPHNNVDIIDLFKLYKKDFIVQKVVEQSKLLSTLNPTTLNTLRVVTYLDKTGTVNVLCTYLRIGKPGSDTDNISIGGIGCSVYNDGSLHSKGFGHRKDGGKSDITTAPSGVLLEGFKIPNYTAVSKMVKQMHIIIPMFKMVSWDIGIDKNDSPILIEYNTLYQSIDMQMFMGPFLGDFTDEILYLGRINS